MLGIEKTRWTESTSATRKYCSSYGKLSQLLAQLASGESTNSDKIHLRETSKECILTQNSGRFWREGFSIISPLRVQQLGQTLIRKYPSRLGQCELPRIKELCFLRLMLLESIREYCRLHNKNSGERRWTGRPIHKVEELEDPYKIKFN